VVYSNLDIICKTEKTSPVDAKIKHIEIPHKLIENFGFKGIILTHTEEKNKR